MLKNLHVVFDTGGSTSDWVTYQLPAILEALQRQNQPATLHFVGMHTVTCKTTNSLKESLLEAQSCMRMMGFGGIDLSKVKIPKKDYSIVLTDLLALGPESWLEITDIQHTIVPSLADVDIPSDFTKPIIEVTRDDKNTKQLSKFLGVVQSIQKEGPKSTIAEMDF